MRERKEEIDWWNDEEKAKRVRGERETKVQRVVGLIFCELHLNPKTDFEWIAWNSDFYSKTCKLILFPFAIPRDLLSPALSLSHSFSHSFSYSLLVRVREYNIN